MLIRSPPASPRRDTTSKWPLAALGCTTLAACFSPSLDGPGGFLCGDPSRACPSGFVCGADNVCRRPGETNPDGTTAVSDGGTPEDAKHQDTTAVSRCALGSPTEVGTASAGNRFAFARDPKGDALAVAYIDGDKLSVVTNSGDGWKRQGGGVAAFAPVALDIYDGVAIVAFRNAAQNTVVLPAGGTPATIAGQGADLALAPHDKTPAEHVWLVRQMEEPVGNQRTMEIRSLSRKTGQTVSVPKQLSPLDTTKADSRLPVFAVGAALQLGFLARSAGTTYQLLVSARVGQSWSNPVKLGTPVEIPDEALGLAGGSATPPVFALPRVENQRVTMRLQRGGLSPRAERIDIDGAPLEDVGRPAIAIVDGLEIVAMSRVGGEAILTARSSANAPWHPLLVVEDTKGGASAVALRLLPGTGRTSHLAYMRLQKPGETKRTLVYRTVDCSDL